MGILNSLDVKAEGSNEISSSAELAQLLRTGERSITPEKGYSVASVWACVNLLANSVAQIPVKLYRREGNNKNVVGRTEHPVARLLAKPNKLQTSFSFRHYQQAARGVYGKSYAFINRIRGGIPGELIPIHPGKVQKSMQGARVIYMVDGKTFTQDQILEINWEDWIDRDGILQGIGPIQKVKDAVGVAIEAERHGSQFFGNGAMPSGILKRDGAGTLDEKKLRMVKESWDRAHGGDNRYGTAVLDGNWDFKPITISSRDAQLIENRKFSVEEIARMYGVPSPMINDLEHATFSNIEQQSINYVVHSLDPHLCAWESALTDSLLTEREQEEYFIEFNVDGLLRGDFKSRMEGYALAIQNRILNPNEVRASENKNAYEGGDEYRNPNIEPGAEAGSEPPVQD